MDTSRLHSTGGCTNSSTFDTLIPETPKGSVKMPHPMSGRSVGPHMDISRLPSTGGGVVVESRLAGLAGGRAAAVPDGCRPAACMPHRRVPRFVSTTRLPGAKICPHRRCNRPG